MGGLYFFLYHEGILPAQVIYLLWCQILPLHVLEILLELPDNMLRFYMVLYFKICGDAVHFVCLAADGTELPALEPIHIGERPAARAPDNNVHGHVVFR